MRQRRHASSAPSQGDLMPAASRSRARGALRFEEEAGAYVFEARDVRYRVVVGGGAVPEGLLAIEASLAFGPWLPLLSEAGMLYRDTKGAVHTPAQSRSRLAVSEFRHSARGKLLLLRYTEVAEQKPLQRTVQIRLVGQTLDLHVKAARTEGAANFCGFALGAVCPGARAEFQIPYATDPVHVLEPAGFACVYLDRFLSHATSAPRGTAFYRAAADGTIAPIDEHVYITVSEDPLEGLPDLPRDRPPHCEELEGRLLLDLWSEQPFAEDAERLAQLRRYGLRALVIAYRNWQQFGHGRRAPVHYPAHLERGRNEPLRRLIREAQEAGALVALEEEYTTLSPQCSYWDERAVARLADGALRPGRDGGYAVAVERMQEFARLEAPQIQRNLAPNAAYLAAHTAWGPEEGRHQIDLFQPRSHTRTFAAAIRCELELFDFYHGVYDGPVLGDGGDGSARFDTCYAGFVDGVERVLEGGAEAPVMPDYELRVVRPVMFNYGVGPYAGFFRTRGDRPPPRELDWDRYRATEIAFGHGGYLSNAGVAQEHPFRWTPCGDILQAFTEYYVLRPLQAQYATAPVLEIQYYLNGSWLGLAAAMRAGLDFAQAQLRIAYANGLTLHVNRHARQEWPVRTESGTFVLPPSGWIAANPAQSFLAYSAQVSGGRADVVRCPDYAFLSARSSVARRIEGITTDGAAAVVRSAAVPGAHDYYLVGGRTLALEWDVLKLSERGDASLIHVGEREVELTLMESESGQSLNVTMLYPSDAWQRARLGLLEWSEGQWRRASNQVQHTKRGLQIARVRPGVVYRLSLPDD